VRRPAPVLVTGASGFVGRHVVAALVRGDVPVRALVRDPARAPARYEAVVGDITDASALERAVASADAVVHLAAATRATDPAVARAVNVEGARLLLEAAAAAGVRRIVALSTVAVHRARRAPYAETKRAMEEILLAGPVEAVVLRPSRVSGPGAAALAARMARVAARWPIVPVVGGGGTVRPVHVDDVVAAVLACLYAPGVAGRCYDLVGPDEVTLAELVGLLGRVQGRSPRTLRVPARIATLGARLAAVALREPPFTPDAVAGAAEPTPADPSPARRELGLPRIGLAEGLPSILDPAPAPGTPRPVRVVVCGAGRMGLVRLALLAALPDAAPVAIVEPDRRAARAARRLGLSLPRFGSLGEALDAVRSDAVVVSTPTDAHADLAVLAARRGCAVFVEKPLARDLAAARAVAEAVAAAGVVAACGYTLAHVPAFERARELVAAGAIGEVSRARARMAIGQVLGRVRGWTYDRRRSGGGALANVGSHALFLLVWILGEPVEVRAETRSVHTALDDEARVEITFASGAVAELQVSWSVAGLARSRTALELEGTVGSLRAEDDSLVLTLRAPAGRLAAGEHAFVRGDLDRSAWFDLGDPAYCRELEDFVRALREGREPRGSIERALAVQAILDAAYRSVSRGGSSVPVPPAAPLSALGAVAARSGRAT
jgi:predicted dehydrogenase/uncharacterized protein YbjT (DUF2867 family)